THSITPPPPTSGTSSSSPSPSGSRSFLPWAQTASFSTPPGTPPLALLLALLVPIALFIASYWTWPAFRETVRTADLQLLSATQSWRFGGFVFLTLYTFGLLPGYFAWPAGLGDMAIALAAPWMVIALHRDPQFATSRTFVSWNILGILDLVVA